MGEAACGQQEDGREGRDAVQQAEEGGPQGRPRRVPPLLDVGHVEDAGRRPLGLAEHLIWEEIADEPPGKYANFILTYFIDLMKSVESERQKKTQEDIFKQ